MPDIGHDNLNADAIYAALVFLRNYSESREGRAAFSELLERKGDPRDHWRGVLSGATIHPIPKFEITPALLEQIYPDEPDSVECGIELGRRVIWGPPSMLELLGRDCVDDPIRQAVRRFIADRAH